MKIHKSIDIAARPEKIWSLLTRPTDLIKWCPVERIEKTSSGLTGLSTTFYFEEKAAGFLLKLHLQITEWVENQRLVFKMISGNTVNSYSQWYSLETISTGCHVNLVEDVSMPLGMFGQVFGLLRKPVSNQRLVTMLSKLKVLAER